MVPRLQGQLIEALAEVDPGIDVVYDPFLGSGTVMTEAMMQGLSFFGGDINPLAVLISQAKSDLFDADLLEQELLRILARTSSLEDSSDHVTFTNIEKWFQPHVIDGLTALRSAILCCPRTSVRRFWWVALAETVRLSSNSRTSTVKLHLRPAAELNNRPDPITLFFEIARRNLRVLRQQQDLLHSRNFLNGATYYKPVSIQAGDVREIQWPTKADLMMTSPPYGDNHTTVTYGQASYLPLNWVDRSDIRGLKTDDCVANTHRLDTLSLGGSKSRTYPMLESLLDRSPHLRTAFDYLVSGPRQHWSRLISFYSDLDTSLNSIVEHVRPGGLMVWTTGNRSIAGKKVIMAPILRELLGRRVELITSLSRDIPATKKRMAPRNALVSTMGEETILVMRRSAQLP